MGLGSARTFTLEQARQRAKEAREKLADKIDPLEARRIERAEKAAAVARSHLYRSREAILAAEPRQVEECQTRQAVSDHFADLCLSISRRFAR